MSRTATVLADASRLSAADRWYFRLESALNLVGGVVIFLLVLLATANVLGRWLFSLPIDGYIDWIEQAMPFIAFLGLAYTQRVGGHIRMDIVVAQLHGRLLWITEMVATLLMLSVTVLLVYGSSLHFWRAYDIGDSSLDIDLPTWPAKLVVPVALTVLALRLLLQIWGYARAVRAGGDTAVAVPLGESAAAAAAREAEAVIGDLDGPESR